MIIPPAYLHHYTCCVNCDFSVWVDTVWDLEFTERKVLDDTIEEELGGGGERAFLTLYRSILALSPDQQQPANKDGASLVRASVCR